ncbi:response regulator [Curvivirga aplysinae]|uniref:response regulator n=1 Tax=Curvivirga aplysinae TaxID=2529852 RepID=UPI0012BD3EDD|nr:response regulator [Curvivirga aplysinae]MTI09586.1 response regulator [Curvivirga aplysinae]
MARYDFSRLSVLVVEDSLFMRSLIVGVLRALGIERISTAENGEEAIAIMSPAGKKTKSMVGMSGIDLIICDQFMPLVDGTMFLHWVRRHDRSPDRFIPFIMVSAAADREVIEKARDAGIDEFLAKPFSATMLASRLTACVERPRPYIYCPTFFGPDRRRRQRPVAEDRRVSTKEDKEIVHSGKDLSSLRKSKKRIWEIRKPRNLKQKLATGFGGAGSDEEPAFDMALLDAAENKVKDMESDYADWVQDSIEKLTQAHHRAIEFMDDPAEQAEHLNTIHTIALELRGQGGIFGYPLMTQFGKSLYECTEEGTRITGPLLDLVSAHIDLIRVVMGQKIKGDGGRTGQELLNSLREAQDKHQQMEEGG